MIFRNFFKKSSEYTLSCRTLWHVLYDRKVCKKSHCASWVLKPTAHSSGRGSRLLRLPAMWGSNTKEQLLEVENWWCGRRRPAVKLLQFVVLCTFYKDIEDQVVQSSRSFFPASWFKVPQRSAEPLQSLAYRVKGGGNNEKQVILR